MNQTPVILAWTTLGGVAGAALALATRPRSTFQGRTAYVVAVAAAAAVLHGLLAWRVPAWPELLGYSAFAALGTAASAVDIAQHRLPRTLVLPAYPAVIVVFGWAALIHDDTTSLLRAALGMLALPAFYLILALLSRGGVGAGDIRLAGPTGWLLTWHNWPTLAAGTLLALVYAASTSLVLIAAGRAARSTQVPYGPAMVAGALTMILMHGG